MQICGKKFSKMIKFETNGTMSFALFDFIALFVQFDGIIDLEKPF